MSLDKKQVDTSLRFSLLDGIFASCMVGFTQDYFIPFLLVLGAASQYVGILNALPNLFASLAQLKSADFVEKVKSRKSIINIFVFLQAVILLPTAVFSFLGKMQPVLFIILIIFFTSFGAIAVPAWASLMSDLVREDKRGEYFGLRNRTLGFVTVIAALFAGLLLHILKKFNIYYGFVAVFGMAFVFRLISWYFLKKMHEPQFEHNRENSFTFFEFLLRIKKSNFAKFVLFVAMMNFSVNLASPFFAVLMLKDLNFSYILYSIITASATLTVYTMMGKWGRQADRIGNLRVIRFVSPIIGILPLLWILNHSPVFLICAQIISGFAWAGFNLCATNFIFDAVTPAKRTRCIAYFNALNGIALCMGALLGAFLLAKLPEFFGYKIFTLFLISSILRVLVGLLMPLKLKEVKKVQDISNIKLVLNFIGGR